ncbi:MAG: DUF1877 family protein [Nostocaceae cyanobacterium]|nr:DUF1877 family protein [Nostocaceae cyanobacterium]
MWFDFGPIRCLSPDKVKQISEQINHITPESLATRYDQALFAKHQIHPDAWWIEDKNDITNQIKDYYSQLVAFFWKAAKSRKYILTYVTA